MWSNRHFVRAAAAVCIFVMIGGAAVTRAASASPTQTVVTLDPTSRFVTPTAAQYGLTGVTLQETGPTGLRSWVVLPANYTPTHCYPVLYLLHAADTVHEWLNAQQLYANLQAIVVIPGGGNGQYTNWWNQGKRSPAWETWFFDELMPEIQQQYPICSDRSMHAIAGSSMGGYGAMFLAAEDPGYFGTAASFSGVIAISNPDIEYGFDTYSDVWGPPGGFYALGHDPASLVANLAHTRLFVYVGDGTPVNAQDVDTGDLTLIEGVMRSEATSFITAAKAADVPVSFLEHPGIHDEANWNISLSDFLAANPFSNVVPAPTDWTYTTVAQSGTAWNWEYRFHHAPTGLERFSELGGTFRGTGTGVVTMTSVTGQIFTTQMPFEFKNGSVRRVSGGTEGTKRAAPLRATVVVNPIDVGRRAALHITLTPKVRLNSHQEYELDAFQPLGKCILERAIYFLPKKPRRTYSYKEYPGNGSGHPAGRWCKGDGTVNLEVVPRHSHGTQVGRLIGRGFFRSV